jgi:hypothetical protein
LIVAILKDGGMKKRKDADKWKLSKNISLKKKYEMSDFFSKISARKIISIMYSFWREREVGVVTSEIV